MTSMAALIDPHGVYAFAVNISNGARNYWDTYKKGGKDYFKSLNWYSGDNEDD